MIVNKNWGVIQSSQNTFIKSKALYDIFDWYDKKYYYVAIDYEKKFDLSEIPNYFLEQIKNNDLTLVICNECEATTKVLDFVYEHIIAKGISNCIYFSNNPNAYERAIELSKKYSAPLIECYLAMEFEYHTAKHYVQKNLVSSVKDYIGSKKFLNLNRIWRTHRTTLVSLLFLENLQQYGHISLGLSESRKYCNFDDAFSNIIKCNPSISEKLVNQKEKILNIPYMYLDNYDLHTNWNMPILETQKFYKDTLLSIISETYFYKNDPYNGLAKLPDDVCTFLTEKTFKPILEGHPFIMVNRPHTLKFLHRLGYKTFDPYIDESYDSIEDDTLRMLEIVKQIKNICNTDSQEFHKKVKPILEHNQNLILNKLNTPKTSYCYELPLCL